ncbi:transglutaminase-like domain-containing protein [Allokutzneria oryzae]|uniref:Transglutaminase family protein n=1 Tax=Allokutzneria oryzae TaxID=1378989 RepID=A0ABV6A710_9PSEU
MTEPLGNALRATEFLDHDSEPVREFVLDVLGDPAELTAIERARELYYAVRDHIDYEVYGADLSRDGLRASSILKRGKGFCVHKSIVYAAAVRAAGVPSRLVYGDVRNHLASERLRELVGGDVFRFHSLASVHLEGKWVKATPVFNKVLCRLYRITPLEFDGRSDSLYHPYDESGRRHMEFLRMHGEFDDFPYDLVTAGIRAAHPKLFAGEETMVTGSLVSEAVSLVP